VQSTTLEDPEPLERIVLAELNTPIEPRREAPVRFRVLDGGRDLEPGRSFLVLTWFHSLMDARGGQNLLEYLDRIDRGDAVLPGDRDWLAEGTDGPRLSLRERRRIAGRSSAYLRTLAPEPPVSPGAALVPPGRACYLQERFVASEDGDQRARRELPWRLALVGKAMADLWRRRGLPDTPFLLPVSVDQRPKGAPGPIFGSRLAFHFARFRPSDTGDLPALSRALRLQMADAVRAGHIEANAVAMEFLHYLPLSTVLRVLPWTAGGELFSFNCADLGEWPLAQCFGRRVLNAYHVPVVPPRPGIGVFFNRCGSHDNLVVSWIEGVVSRDDAARIVEVVRDGMGWTRSP
jgi:hypothetical protein